jgi:uncharacterized damage-inducible protein DinB
VPGNVPPVANEREGLLAFLAQQRHVLRIACYGLTDEQARATPTVSSLSVGGLIKHVAAVEQNWIDTVLGRPGGSEEDYQDNLRLGPGETLADALARYDDVAENTEDVLAGIADLDQPVPVPKGVPWFPDDVDAWSVRWVLLHLIQETARHAGHADIVRELIDGKTGE